MNLFKRVAAAPLTQVTLVGGPCDGTTLTLPTDLIKIVPGPAPDTVQRAVLEASSAADHAYALAHPDESVISRMYRYAIDPDTARGHYIDEHLGEPW